MAAEDDEEMSRQVLDSLNQVVITGSGSDEGIDVGHKFCTELKQFDILQLPQELVTKVLLRMCAREEAASKVVCKDFNLLMHSDSYSKSQRAPTARQIRSSTSEQPQYFGGFLSNRCSYGWDPAAGKWVALPSLAFIDGDYGAKDVDSLLNPGRRYYECDIYQGRISNWKAGKGYECTAEVHCSCDGLVYFSTVFDYLLRCTNPDRRLTGVRSYVCNPLTKSYVRVAELGLGSGTVMRVGEGGSGFMVVARYGDAVTELHLMKLDSTNLEAEWQELSTCPEEVWISYYSYETNLVLVERVVHLICVTKSDRFRKMMSFNMDQGVWKSHDVVISRSGTHAALNISTFGTQAEVKFGCQERDVKLQLLQVGGRVWLVICSWPNHRRYRENPYLGSVLKREKWRHMADISICSYDVEEEEFIVEATRQLHMDGLHVYGNGSSSTICFLDGSDPGGAVVYDVFKKRWFEADRGVKAWPNCFSFYQFCFQLSHASVKHDLGCIDAEEVWRSFLF